MKKVREALIFLERECQLFENSSSKQVEKVAREALSELDNIQQQMEKIKDTLDTIVDEVYMLQYEKQSLTSTVGRLERVECRAADMVKVISNQLKGE